jgi:hypothetical protein
VQWKDGSTTWVALKDMKHSYPVQLAEHSIQRRIASEKPISELPPGYQKITGHMIFDVKMGENFRQKARFVADGHKTKAPAALCYSFAVSRDSVRIALTIAALNDLDILACDMQNACLTADCRERESGS